jgi:Protein of unknown function (DUF4242)
MKNIIAIVLLAASLTASAVEGSGNVRRYIVERTFPKGALAGLDAAAKEKVNANNARFGVHWVMSYANQDETKTYCVYEGPNENAIRDAARLNAIPVDSITEVPVTLESH